MRDSDERPPLSMTVRLMIALVAVFAVVQIAMVYLNGRWLEYLPLSYDGLRRGFVWQLLTFQFVHVGLFHLAGNLLGLWFCGRFAEHVLGRGRFLAFYLGTGVVGGLFHVALAAALPKVFGAPVYGASAGVMALVALFCLLQPEAEFLFMFVVRIKAKVLLIVETAIALFFTLVPSDPGVAHAAHLGGIVAAMVFFRLRWHDEMMPLPGADWFGRIKSLFRRQPVRRPQPSLARKPVESRREPAKVIEVTPEEFMAREVDPILEKIAAHGIHSLTAREKETLERARSRMSKR
jgi:membrane associated rhomboid family serine protease